MAVDTGHGATITFGTTGGTWLCTRIAGPDQQVPVVNTSHLGTSTRQTTMSGDLIELGEVTLTILFQGSQGLPTITTNGASETITITHPLASGNTTPANLAGTGFIRRTKYPDFATNEMQVGEIVFKYNGTTLTFTPAS